ncbi:lipoprotein signal peptidase [Klebsiella pneumoniae]|uniref:Lipoprotein signal peptidase n=1 Tax=Klebsiella pneumoniae TaxID=573 RepID=A0A378FXC0_KLEPN|nr:lipoprotein signal peptidase [Klebsiella pneumoniae]
MYRSKATQKLNNIAYALIIGGALGNLFDRLWHGFVVDMIDFYVGDWHFATSTSPIARSASAQR